MAEGNVAHSSASVSRNYLIPKEVTDALITMGQVKSKAPVWKTFIGSLYSGVFVVFGGMISLTVAGGIDAEIRHANPMVHKCMIGLTFWLALLLILTYGGELLTGNLMYFTLAFINRRVSILYVLRNWAIVFCGNFISCAGFGIFLGYLGEFFNDEPYRSLVIAITEKKVNQDFGQAFFRAIGANWMVCLAVSMSVGSQDQFSKTVCCFVPVFLFATVGFEHCVANMFFVPLGLMYGADTTFWRFLYKNLIPVTLGNFVGGAGMCGGGLYLLYKVESITPKCLQSVETIGESDLARRWKDLHDNYSYPVASFQKKYLRGTGEVINLQEKAIILVDENNKALGITSRLSEIGDDTQQRTGYCALSCDDIANIEFSMFSEIDPILCKILGYKLKDLKTMQLCSITYSADLTLSSTLFSASIDKWISKSRRSVGIIDVDDDINKEKRAPIEGARVSQALSHMEKDIDNFIFEAEEELKFINIHAEDQQEEEILGNPTQEEQVILPQEEQVILPQEEQVILPQEEQQKQPPINLL
eukprot:GHVR01173877.1.p1 GENE.GHVR01173877.1~~GHVR01173877.1.p1  ORF type:complete len:540 (+),score=78.43 GHVR01173877.1:28-1620(+)